jgi:serine phosphatase RsbU (regulator of sigma subunit)
LAAQDSRDSAEDKLQDLQVLVDAALSRLSPADFLAELLTRAKAILDADTATVLVLDHASRYLVATAASGLEEEVLQGVRIPVGTGFAGRIAAENQPMIIEQVDHTNVVNPVLLAKGIRSLAGVPLLAGGTVIGALHVGSLTTRQFTSEDVEILKLVASQAATAVESLTAEADRRAAAVLQQSLLPSTLPAINGMEIAGRYVAGRGMVGGDWYDVFVLPAGQLGVVIGDVAGSGLPAAVIMGRMRSALRAYAVETADPAEVLARLDRKMQHFEPDAMATVAYAVFDPPLNRMHISSAGHLPPVLAVPGKPATPASIAGDPLIGFAPAGQQRQVTTIEIPPGSVVCFYTDGLVERPSEPIDEGLARLCQAVSTGPPEAVCSAVILSLVGPDGSHDDIALLILRRQPPDPGRHN